MNLILKRIESVVLLITSPFVMVLLPRKDRCNDGNDLAPGAVALAYTTSHISNVTMTVS